MARGDDTKEAGQSTQDRVNAYPATGVTPVLIFLAVLGIFLIVFLAQNAEAVPVEFLAWEADVPLFVVVLVSLAVASLTTLAVAGVWRRRRRHQRTEHEELQRLRQGRNG